jgi:CubicO group peptidase (beta-lactamase class C family)
MQSSSAKLPLTRSGSLSSRVDAIFDPVTAGQRPGAAVLVVKDGVALHQRGYGFADLTRRTPITPETVFRLASITKQFTAMAIMILAEEARLDYDDPVYRILPEFASHAREVTLRHLLNHTSGLADYQDLFIRSDKVDDNYPRAARREGGEYEPTSADALKLISDEMLRFVPGDEWEYSNSGYVALAQAVERVSGRAFSRFLRGRIFEPLKMTNSVLYDHTAPEIVNGAISYGLESGSFRPLDYTPLNFIYGQDNIYSTLRDMAQWFTALHWEPLVKQSALQQAFASAHLNNGALPGYGFGWFVAEHFGLSRATHSGSWGGFRNFVAHYPSVRLSIAVLSNFDGFDDVARSAIAGRIANVYLSREMQAPRKAMGLDPEYVRKFAGTYRAYNDELIDIRFEENSLTVNSLVPIRLIPESGVKFFVEDAEGDSYFFDLDDNGSVRGLRRHLSLFGYSLDAFTKARKIDGPTSLNKPG